jgi:hypothetical protein
VTLRIATGGRLSQLTEEPTQHAEGDHDADASASLALVVHGRLSGGRGNAGPIRAVSGGWLGLQVLVDVVKLAVNRCLALQVLAMQPLDQLMGWLFALVVGVMAVAEEELAQCRLVPRVRRVPPGEFVIFVSR